MSTQDTVLDSLQFIELAINQLLLFHIVEKQSFNKLSSNVKSPHFKNSLKPIIKGLCMVFQNIKNDGIRSQTMDKLLDIRNCAFHYKVMIDDFPDGLTGLMRLTPSERLREYIVDLLLCTPPNHLFSWIHPILIRPFISLQFLVHRTKKILVSHS